MVTTHIHAKKSRSKDSWYKWENGNGRTVTTIALPSPPTLKKYTYGPYIEIMHYINLLVTLTRVINVSYTQQWITQILCSLWRTFYEISTKKTASIEKLKRKPKAKTSKAVTPVLSTAWPAVTRSYSVLNRLIPFLMKLSEKYRWNTGSELISNTTARRLQNWT